MALHDRVLREITGDLQTSPFLTLMADETTDATNKEQVTLVLHWVTEELYMKSFWVYT